MSESFQRVDRTNSLWVVGTSVKSSSVAVIDLEHVVAHVFMNDPPPPIVIVYYKGLGSAVDHKVALFVRGWEFKRF